MLRSPEHDAVVDELQIKIKTLHSSIWERRAAWPEVLEWLDQFSSDRDPLADEQLHALRLLSNFMFFGVNEIRALLRSLYRDTFRPSIAKELRTGPSSGISLGDIGRMVDTEIQRCRFVSLGNPSESSAMLLYYFRQENNLPKDLFIHGSEIFDRSHADSLGGIDIRDRSVNKYIFIDDLCGSGQQGEEYSQDLVEPLKRIDSSIKVYYYPLFALSDGVDYLRSNAHFDLVSPVVELDASFRAFAKESRLFVGSAASQRASCEAVCRRRGSALWPEHPLGYQNGQLYIGFAHNTPDNTMPIFWSDHTASVPWRPIFRRYAKVF